MLFSEFVKQNKLLDDELALLLELIARELAARGMIGPMVLGVMTLISTDLVDAELDVE